ncbi:solute carrier family 35 member C2 isoform X6 [Hemicordylus capensis]|uniref:solute carrier family 35 member C2 isoform X6 n=1 Tax=Hemicordylus capensis TaxID=884348 RepID=UPI0023034257|nr:solute carrier family 35 member C2 isoform X6 [Hemicordylus capensis]
MPPPPSGRRVGGAARRAAAVAGLVLLYYGFSIGITFYNKWLMKSFGFPLFMTLLHLLVIFALSGLARRCCCAKRPARVVLPWAGYLRQVAPAALSTALDVGLSNWSFLYITVSLYTMTKSSAVLFILLFSLAFKLEEPRAALILVVLLIAGGLFLFTYKATQFDLEGFALVLGASFLGGIRWTLTQMLLQKEELGLKHPIDTMFHLQPAMFLGLFPLFAAFEGPVLSCVREAVPLPAGRAAAGLAREACPWRGAGFRPGLLRVPPGVQNLQPRPLRLRDLQGHKGPKQHKEAGSGPDLELLLLHQHQEEAEAAGSLQP